MTNCRTSPIVARPYALRFDLTTPGHVIEAAIREANELLTAQLPGLLFFPFEWKEETAVGQRFQAVHLHADDAGWERFRARGISTVPLLARRMDISVSRRRRPDSLGREPLAMAS
ncbi:hypothetical protein E4T66_17930 [Sinimarinibacterium sp. CAU 1509]|uniref:hypothetical protein n=1 Tax=Sinimarinibacterium sp. CAU 1509 TaxID=2562283 RepID=UPI0010AD02C2|nr:hypothetical protein [Sinimarinibacterium sp. CAU 1509]TJY57285.1 hypothetical protein E4T66_17930 [Sinimarinibacterium sp. CAU 1509]